MPTNCKSIKNIKDCKSEPECFWGSMGKSRKPSCYNKKHTSKRKNNEYLMIMDTAHESKTLYEQNDFFRDLSKYSKIAQLIGSASVNGSVFKIDYDGIPLIMKVTQDDDSDSLIYEYLAGLCLSHYSFKFPIFSKVVNLVHLNPRILSELYTQSSVHNISFENDVQIVNEKNVKRLVSDGCLSNSNYSLITQYLPNTKSFADYTMECNVEQDKFANLISQMTFLYVCLHGMENIFTHYDLHNNNVLMVSLRGKYINVKMNLKNGDVVNLKMFDIPYIIDYGSVFVNCNSINTKKVMTEVCESSACQPNCGMGKGYNFIPTYLGNGNFDRARSHEYYLDRTRANQSHDLKLLNFTKNAITVTSGLGHTFKDLILKKMFYLHHYGTYEQNKPHDYTNILNLEGVVLELLPFLQRSDFNEAMDRLCAGKQCYGNLEIWQDMSRDFVLTPN